MTLSTSAPSKSGTRVGPKAHRRTRQLVKNSASATKFEKIHFFPKLETTKKKKNPTVSNVSIQKKRGARNALLCRPKLHVLTTLTTLRGQYKKLTAPVIVLPKLVRTSISFRTAESPLCLPSASPFSLLSSLRIEKVACSGEWTCSTRPITEVNSCAQRRSGVRGNNEACSLDETAQKQTDQAPNAKNE